MAGGEKVVCVSVYLCRKEDGLPRDGDQSWEDNSDSRLQQQTREITSDDKR